jgi:hypothetical protein
MNGQEMIALGLVALTAALFAWRWWRRRLSGSALPCGHCCGGAGSSARPLNVNLRATKNGPISIGLNAPDSKKTGT